MNHKRSREMAKTSSRQKACRHAQNNATLMIRVRVAFKRERARILIAAASAAQEGRSGQGQQPEARRLRHGGHATQSTAGTAGVGASRERSTLSGKGGV